MRRLRAAQLGLAPARLPAFCIRLAGRSLSADDTTEAPPGVWRGRWPNCWTPPGTYRPCHPSAYAHGFSLLPGAIEFAAVTRPNWLVGRPVVVWYGILAGLRDCPAGDPTRSRLGAVWLFLSVGLGRNYPTCYSGSWCWSRLKEASIGPVAGNSSVSIYYCPRSLVSAWLGAADA